MALLPEVERDGTRGRAFSLGPATSTPCLISMRSALRQVRAEYPVTRESAAPLGTDSPGDSVPSAICARMRAATC